LAKKTSGQSHISRASRVGLLTWHRRPRATRTATHLEPAIHPHLHDRLGLAQLGVRHPHLPYPPHGIPRQRHPVRSGWLIESAITELAVTLVLRALMTGLLGTRTAWTRPATTWRGCPATVWSPRSTMSSFATPRRTASGLNACGEEAREVHPGVL